MLAHPLCEYACPEDLPLLSRHDRHVSGEVIARKVERREIVVARLTGAVAGWLRFGYFWDEVPFMNLLRVLPPHRGQGIGTALVAFWEQEMRRLGCEQVLTSTQSDETAQHFYRKLGYMDIGGFVLPGEPMEILLHKSLRQGPSGRA